MKRPTHRLIMTLLVLPLALLASGCIVHPDVFDHGIDHSDLVVEWSVAGHSRAHVCNDHDVDYWIVEISGPEYRRVRRDCYAGFWTSDSDFYSLHEGNYDVRIEAFNHHNQLVGHRTTRISFLGYSFFDEVFVELHDHDFHR